MKLKSITAKNLKGHTFVEDLAPAQFFIGRNATGKTTRTDAIRLVLIGYLPELGKTAKATFGLCSGTELVVEAKFDTGEKITRRWWLQGDTVKSEETIPSSLADVDLLVMLNADEYFGLGNQARTDYVFSRCRLPDTFSPRSVCDRLAKVEGVYHGPEIGSPLIDTILGGETMEDATMQLSVQEFIDGAITTVEGAVKTAKDHAKTMANTIQGMSHLRAGDQPATGESALQAQKDQLAAAIQSLLEERAGLNGTIIMLRNARMRREVIGAELRLGDHNRQKLADAKSRLNLLREQLADIPVTDLAEMNGIQQSISALQSELAVAKQAITNARTLQHGAERELADLEEKTECPYCGATGDLWKNIRAAELTQKVEAMDMTIGNEGRKRDDLNQRIDVLQKALIERQNNRQMRDVLSKDEADQLREVAKIEPALARLDTLAEELKNLAPDDPAVEARVQTIDSDVTVKRGQLKTIEAALKTALGRKHELQRLADAEVARDLSQANQKVATAALKELRTIQAEMVAAAFQPLLDRANGFFGSILISPLAYNVDGGEIGTWRDGLWVGHHTMSGTEKALVYAAIQAALASDSPVRIMLIDELGRLDHTNKLGLIAAVVNAIGDGRLDNFVATDAGFASDVTGFPSCGVKVIGQ